MGFESTRDRTSDPDADPASVMSLLRGLLYRIIGLSSVTLGASSDRSFSSTSQQSGALTGTLVRLVSKSADCRIAIGSSPTATTTGTLLIQGQVEYFKITSGDKIAAIRDASTDGSLNITVVSQS